MPYSRPLSGSSGSAAIVAGVAASVWRARPTLDAHQVMALVYDGGIPLDGARTNRARTEFCLGQPAGDCHKWPVHRVFLCGALAKALPEERLACDFRSTSDLVVLEGHHLDRESDRRPPAEPDWKLPADNLSPAPPCEVTGCGKNIGTMAVQRPNGAVPQQPFSGCPGCTLFIQRNVVSGILNRASLFVPQMTSAIVQTQTGYPDYLPNEDIPLGSWNVDSTFSKNLSMPQKIGGATLVILYNDENSNAASYSVTLSINRQP
jgi:hypothetical protein